MGALAAAFLPVVAPGFADEVPELAGQEIALRESFSAIKSPYSCVENPSFGDVWNGLLKARYVPGKFVCANKKGTAGRNVVAPERVKDNKWGVSADLAECSNPY